MKKMEIKRKKRKKIKKKFKYDLLIFIIIKLFCEDKNRDKKI